MRFKFVVISGVIPEGYNIVSLTVASEGMALYLHSQQREQIRRLSDSLLWRSEMPTWLLIVAIYGGWFTTLAYWHVIGLLPATLLLIGFST